MYIYYASSVHSRVFYNENVNRHSMSERQVRYLRRPDYHTPMKVLVKKSYGFVEKLWAAYLASNCSDLRYIFMRADLHYIHA